jgi:D-3-phosphoglycerate dehydrogenase / 2-oxoglutarate reductase
MSDSASESVTVDSLVLDLLEWIGPAARPYDEVMEAWRTSCPRLPVWERANEMGFVERRTEPGNGGQTISVSSAGAAHLRTKRPMSALQAEMLG